MKAVFVADSMDNFGLDLSADLARLGYLVITVAQTSKDSENTKREILNRFNKAKIEVIVGSYSTIKDIRQILLNIKLVLTNYRLDGIYAYIGNHQTFEKDYIINSNDIEKQFFENYLVNFILCYSLIPYLQKEKGAKIILPTLAQKELATPKIQDFFNEKNYNGAEMFRLTKTANAMMAGEFNRKFNVGENAVETILYQEKMVSKLEELNTEPKLRGLKKLFNPGDRLFKVYSGIEAILTISSHKPNEMYFKFSKPMALPNISKNENLCASMFEISEKIGRLKY